MSEIRFGGYRVTEVIGQGALSTLYKAVHEPLGRPVAIKALKSTIAPSSSFAAQLEREARVLLELSHPNVVFLLDYVTSDEGGRSFLVLEYVDGWSLSDLLAKKKALRSEVAAAIAIGIAAALAHAHERGVVHRDVKPANVLLSRRGDVKLVDFGIAQRERLPNVNEPLVRESDAFGTPAYMSPEQILGELVDGRSDLFSLGVALYQMLSGTRPFDRPDEKGQKSDAAQRIRRDAPAPLRDRAPDVARPLERLVMRLIEKLPADRPPSATVVGEALSGYLRSRTRESRAKLIARSLYDAGLLKEDPRKGGTGPVAERQARRKVTRALAGLFGIGATFVATAFAIEYAGWSSREALGAGAAPLELAPVSAGGLHVLATPWAEVWIDGQKVDVTPFARAIPLRTGTHYVTLVHPNAAIEKREITIGAGETTTLDVTMQLVPETSSAGRR